MLNDIFNKNKKQKKMNPYGDLSGSYPKGLRFEPKGEATKKLTIFFYLTHIKREDIGFLIQFLQKFNLDFSRIKNEKQINSSKFLLLTSNFMAQSSKAISLEEFQTICKFLNTQTQAIVVGYQYENIIWDISRTKTPSILKSNNQETWNILKLFSV